MNKKPVIGEEVYAPVLRTGDRFITQFDCFDPVEYEFVGYAPFDGTGCHYVICKRVDNGEYTGLDRYWFDRDYCGRKIKILERGKNNGVRAQN